MTCDDIIVGIHQRCEKRTQINSYSIDDDTGINYRSYSLKNFLQSESSCINTVITAELTPNLASKGLILTIGKLNKHLLKSPTFNLRGSNFQNLLGKPSNPIYQQNPQSNSMHTKLPRYVSYIQGSLIYNLP